MKIRMIGGFKEAVKEMCMLYDVSRVSWNDGIGSYIRVDLDSIRTGHIIMFHYADGELTGLWSPTERKQIII